MAPSATGTPAQAPGLAGAPQIRLAVTAFDLLCTARDALDDVPDAPEPVRDSLVALAARVSALNGGGGAATIQLVNVDPYDEGRAGWFVVTGGAYVAGISEDGQPDWDDFHAGIWRGDTPKAAARAFFEGTCGGP